MILGRVGLAAVMVANVVAGGCSRTQSAPAPDPIAILEAIPAADARQYDRVTDMKQWRNPYVIVRADGVALLDAADSAEIILKPEELLGALSRLPATNWPYGRVVAAAEGPRATEQEGIAIRRNKGIVGGVLESAHVAVKWVPGS